MPLIVVLTARLACLPTHAFGLWYGVATHCAAVSLVLVDFRLRTARRRRRQRRELAVLRPNRTDRV